MIELLIVVHDFIKIYIFKQILILNFILTKLYNNNNIIRIAFTRCNAWAFFIYYLLMFRKIFAFSPAYICSN